MAAGDMEQFARIAAIAAGIVFGGWALSSVIWVWTKRQIYAYGGSALSVVGVILMGLSIYKTVDVHAAADGIGIKLSEVEKLLKEQGQAQQETQSKLASLPSDLGSKIADLDKTVKEQGSVQAAQLRKLDNFNGIVQRASALKDPATAPVWYWDYPSTDPGGFYPQSTTSANAQKLHIGSFKMLPDGAAIYGFSPDYSDPAYIARLQGKISKAKADKGDHAPELQPLFMSLGDTYKAQGKLDDALAAYSQGLALLKEQAKTPSAPEPEKK
jgi:hypothetical protein